MGKYEDDRTKFIPTPKKCQNPRCGIMLKNKKRYIFLGVVKFTSGFWTLKKKCKRCGHINVDRGDKK